MPKILIIDDDIGFRFLLKDIITRFGFETIEASNAEEGKFLIENKYPDCVLLDNGLPGESGLVMLHEIMARRHPPIILMSGNMTYELEKNGLSRGAYACFGKETLTKDNNLVDAITKAIGEASMKKAI